MSEKPIKIDDRKGKGDFIETSPVVEQTEFDLKRFVDRRNQQRILTLSGGNPTMADQLRLWLSSQPDGWVI